MQNWTPIKKIVFRFIVCYFTLFALSNQFITIFAFGPLWRKVVPWFADVFLNLDEPITIFTNGSGDTTFNYVSLLVYLILSVLITILWSVLDRKRSNYNQFMRWFTSLIRYYLIYQMLIYGLAKVFYLQFQPPRYARLIQQFGDASPMGLLWTFMGFSKGYTIFTGVGEILGGLFLLTNRTKTLGALIVFGVMANVMALNYFYDVPVKILSTHLVLMALFLILLDWKRLFNLFFSNREIQPIEEPTFFPGDDTDKVKNIIKWIILIGGIAFLTNQTYQMIFVYGSQKERPVLEGLYEVDYFSKNGEIQVMDIRDESIWKRIAVDHPERAMIEKMNGSEQYVTFLPDTTDQSIIIAIGQDTVNRDTLYYSYPDSAHIRFDGVFLSDTISVQAKIWTRKDFYLTNRDFHWIQEYPNNR